MTAKELIEKTDGITTETVEVINLKEGDRVIGSEGEVRTVVSVDSRPDGYTHVKDHTGDQYDMAQDDIVDRIISHGKCKTMMVQYNDNWYPVVNAFMSEEGMILEIVVGNDVVQVNGAIADNVKMVD
jgi:hypothetical protein